MGNKPYWNDAAVYEVNRLPAHGAGFPSNGVAAARRAGNSAVCLDGEWLFGRFDNDRAVPADFYSLEFDESGFDAIAVPSNWQMLGYDIPIYSNLTYPYPMRYGALRRVPNIAKKRNSAGCYRRRFDFVPQKGRRAILRFDGICSCGYIYLNGEFVGYTQSSFNISEFDVTDLAVSGENLLAVKVMRYCDGSYLENQDMWRMSGIFRSVYIYQKSEKGISDVSLSSRFDGEYKNANFIVRVSAESCGDNEYTAAIALYDADGVEVVSASAPIVGGVADFEPLVRSVNKWSPGDPYLYRAVVSVVRGERTLDCRGFDFGFRSVEISKYAENSEEPHLLLNGKKLKIRGVNRHEFDPRHGFAVSADFNAQDVKLIKRCNFNAVRTSHYPPSEAMLTLCDKYGLLVMCENNLETHIAGARLPRSKPLWKQQALARMRAMVEAYKNHTSIFMWSLGNESGRGDTFTELYALAHELDDTRPVHYECMPEASDVISGMYNEPEVMLMAAKHKTLRIGSNTYNPLGNRIPFKKYADKPYLQCEYSHCMGNSLGNFSKYWELFYKYDRLCGGFIWDFADLGIFSDGAYRYGGDFGDAPNDGNFCFNGLVRGDRVCNPAMQEAKNVMAPYSFAVRDGNVIFGNLDEFYSLSGCAVEVTAYDSQKQTYKKRFDGIDIPPKGRVSLEVADLPIGADCAVTVRLINTKPTPYSAAGHEIYAATRSYGFAPAEIKYGGKIEINKTVATLESEGTTVAVDINRAEVTSVRRDGYEFLLSPIRPDFYRAPIDNERLLLMPQFVRRLRGVDKREPLDISVEGSDVVDGGLVLRCKANGFSSLKLIYRMLEGGELFIRCEATPKRSIKKSGFAMGLSPDYNRVEYLGYGPYENYPDRNSGAALSVYKQDIGEFCHRYLKPQENGNRTGVRRITFGNGEASVTVGAVGRPLNISAYPFTTEALASAAHDTDLSTDEAVTVSINGAVRGVGGDRPGFSCVRTEHEVRAKKLCITAARLSFKKA